MLKMKLIGAVSLVLGAVACEPMPVYPPEGNRQYPQRRAPQPQPELRDNRDNRGYQDQRNNRDRDPLGNYDNRAPAPPTYPTAERTDNPNRVISPFSPYNVIDVEGFRSGQLAKDPSNGQIFRIP
jgi:hypothetical protein